MKQSNTSRLNRNRKRAGGLRYLLPDGLGSVRQALDEDGQPVSYYEFDPYGNPVNNTQGGDPYGYTGEWWDSATELLHLRARWYFPETGTFISKDPVESEPAYLYVYGNPATIADPSGLFPPIPSNDTSTPYIGQYSNSTLAQNQWKEGPCSDWRGVPGWISRPLCLSAHGATNGQWKHHLDYSLSWSKVVAGQRRVDL